MNSWRKLAVMGGALLLLAGCTVGLIALYGPKQRSRNASPEHIISQVSRQMMFSASELFEQERYPEAERILRQLLGFDRHNIAALRMLGNLQYITGRYSDASGTFRLVLAIAPQDPVAHSNLGMSMIRMQWYEAGIRELLTARALDPELPFIDRNLGHAYGELGNLEKAAQYLKIAEEKGLPPPESVAIPGEKKRE